MKTSKAILSALLMSALASCQNQGDLYEAENGRQNDYLKSWISKFGLIDPTHTWNMATLVQAEVDPSAFGDNVTVKIYEGNPRNGGRLVGKAYEKGTLKLDVVNGTKELYVKAVGADRKMVYSGIHQILGGAVLIDRPSSYKARAKSRAEGDEDATAPRFDWTLAVEDLGGTDDFDFNDVVIGVNHVAGTGIVTLTALAAGGTLEAKVYVGDTYVGEIHKLVANDDNAPHTVMLNTSEWIGLGKKASVFVGDKWSMSENMGNIRIKVNGVDKVIAAPDREGEAPQIICIAGDWEWPKERVSITDAYSTFKSWSNDASDLSWTHKKYDDTTMEWKELAQATDPVTPGEDEDEDPVEEEDTRVPVADYSLKMINSQGQIWSALWYPGGTDSDAYKTYGINKNNTMWDYVPGLVTKAMLTYCEKYDAFGEDGSPSDIYSYCINYADDGVGNNAFKTGSLDNAASGKVLLSMYRKTNEAKYLNEAKTMYEYLRGDYTTSYTIQSGYGAGGFWHKTEYPNQMWLDGLYMGAAFMAEYVHTANPTDAATAWQQIYDQFRIVHSKTKKSNNLNCHAWSAAPTEANSFWADPSTGQSPEVWGRAIGWYIAALVDVLEYMPKGDNYNAMCSYLRDVASGVTDYQDATGVWYQLLERMNTTVTSNLWETTKSNGTKIDWANKGENFTSRTSTYSKTGGIQNYLEASASSMITYGLYKGIRLGVLDRNTYLPVAERAYDGLLTQFIKPAGSYSERVNDDSEVDTGGFKTVNKTFTAECNIVNICKSAGLGSSTKWYRDGSTSYYLNGKDAGEVVCNEGKGIGAFIFAAIEHELAHPQEVAAGN